MNDLDSARLYTDFNGLARLRARASSDGESAAADRASASKEVARQFEAIFLQTMLKTMREASQLSETTESDQTRFYMEMFDKQIAIDLASRGDGIGFGKMLEHQLGGNNKPNVQGLTESDELNVKLVQDQLELVSSGPAEDR